MKAERHQSRLGAATGRLRSRPGSSPEEEGGEGGTEPTSSPEQENLAGEAGGG